MIRVLLVDDHAMLRDGFRLVLESQDDIEVVGEAADGETAIALTRQLAPDVVVMDIRMPGLDGLEATRTILGGAPDGPRVLILTTFDLDEYLYAAMRAGASGFLLKTAPARDLAPALRRVVAGEELLAPEVTRRLVEQFLERPPAPPGPDPRLDELTAREVEVLTLIGSGATNADIAAHFVISPATVKTHVNRIFAKAGVRDRAQAVILAYECGLVRVGGRPGGAP